MGNIVGIPRRVFIVALAILTADVAWVLWAAFARQLLWPPVAVFVSTAVPVLTVLVMRGAAVKMLVALVRSALTIAVGYVIGVPILVWLKHETWASVWQDWSPVVIVLLVVGVAFLLLGRTVRARQV